MFDSFADQWTPVELSRRLKRRPIHLRVAGTPVVLFRDAERRAHALLDACPHRGVRLSRGRVTGEGRLQCPFHGWEFEGRGGCTHVPLTPDAKLERYAATALPTHEEGGLVWLRTAPGVDAPDAPYVPEALVRPRLARWYHVVEWETHWTRAMENMLDSPHLPWVHHNTIGLFLKRRMKRDSKMEVHVQETRTGFRTTWTLDGEEMPGSWLEWGRPNGMALNIPIPGRTFRVHVWCVPVDDARVRMILCSARSFGRFNPLMRAFDEVNRYIARQDRVVLERTEPPEVPHPSAERSVPTDRATLFFRNWYLRSLKGRPADEPAPPREGRGAA